MTRGIGSLCLALAASAWTCSHPPAEDHAKDSAEATSDSQQDRVIALSPEAQRSAGVQIAVASRQAFAPRLEAPGTIRPDTQKSVAVRAPLPGCLGRVLVDVGTRVRRGTPLATLTGTEVSDAVARFRTAGAKADAARRALARADRLLALQAISRAERETRAAENEVAAAELAAAAQDLRTLGISGRGVAASADIVAPIGGVVLEKTASPGLLVDKDAPLFVVADLSTVWAVVDVYEKDVAGVTRGGEAEVRSDTYADAAWRGPVGLVEPAVDEASKMARVRIVLANPDRRLRPGMRVTAALPLQQSAGMAVTAVPVLAVQRLSGVTSVFAEVTPGHYVLRTVELGRERGGVVEVTAGLREGERIVVAGGFYLKGELLKARFGAEFALVEFC